MNNKILEAAKKILELLPRLIPDDAEHVLVELKVLIEQAEQDPDNQEISNKIIKLLSDYPETKEWMEDRLTPLESFSATREVEVEDTPHLYPVWFGTNRKPIDKDDLSKGFSGDRADDINAVHYGVCNVAVPSSHNFGEIGRSWWQRWSWSNFSFDKEDNLTVEKITVANSVDDFWKSCNESLSNNELTERDVLVFIHGFNNSFEDAAIRAAQIGFDLKVKGYTAFFSWPSKAQVSKYSSDESTIIASENAITQFLIDLTKKSGANRVNLIAHSMGNRGLLAALKNIKQKVNAENEDIQFGQIILAAPDLDVDVFRQAKTAYTELSKRTTIYTSETDKAVAASQWLHDFPRVGTLPPITVEEGIDTIKVSKEAKIFEFGHGYFAETEGLLHDMYDLIRHGEAPDDRQRLHSEVTGDGKIYWRIEA